MLIRGIAVFVGLWLSAAFTATAGAAEAFTTAQPGMWSVRGVYLWPGPTAIADVPMASRQLHLAGPDGKTALHVGDIEAYVVSPSGRRSAGFGIPSLAELVWSPNTRAFALTESDGGWVGSWSVRIALLSPSGNLQFHQISRSVAQDFYLRTSKRKCPEQSNVAAIAWTKGTEELLLVAEAPPHSSCPVMTAVCGYMVAVPSGVIRRRVSPQILEKEWGNVLGPRLRRVQKANSAVASGSEEEQIQIDCGERLLSRAD